MISLLKLTLFSCFVALLPVTLHGETPQPFQTTRKIQAGKHVFTADLGMFEAPEDPNNPDSNRISIAVCRLRGKQSGTPLFFLPGLPASATRTHDDDDWAAFWSDCLVAGDVVLMDQRGVGRSRPRLVFESPDWNPWLMFSDEATAQSHFMDTAKAARRFWHQRGVNLSCYNVQNSANDLEIVRERIGYKKINLLGHSSGSHLALTYVRRFDDRVHRLISTGTAGTNHIMKPPLESDRAFRHVADLFAASRSAGRQPDLEQQLRNTLQKLDQQPLMVEIIDPSTRESRTVALGKFGFQFLILRDLADKQDIPKIPSWIESVERGDSTLIQPVLQKRINSLASLPLPLFTSRAASGATAGRWLQIAREAPESIFGRVRMLFCPELADALGVADLGDEFRQPVHSNVKSLFVSGTLDANTPPEQAAVVRQGFPNSAHIILQHGGHNEVLRDRTLQKKMAAFLNGKQTQTETIPGDPPAFK